MIALVFAAALQAELPPSSEALSPVPDPVLSRLLDGIALDRVGVVIHDHGEFFFPGGRYVVQGRATSVGRYRVSGSRICTRIREYPENCFRIFTDNRGRLFSDDMFKDGHVSEVRFVPVLSGR